MFHVVLCMSHAAAAISMYVNCGAVFLVLCMLYAAAAAAISVLAMYLRTYVRTYST